MNRPIGILFLLTGIFAIISALFSWGSGWLFDQAIGPVSILLYSDLILTGPLAILSGMAIMLNWRFSKQLAVLTSGMMLAGSVQVWFLILKGLLANGLMFWIPSLFGAAMAVLVTWYYRKG